MKTCRRRAGGNFHLKAALDRVGILTVFSGEDQRSARPRSCASTPCRSRFNAAVGDATDPVSDCGAGAREPAQEDAAAVATVGVEGWAESEQKGLFRYATGSRCPLSVCPRPRPCPRPRLCLLFGAHSST